MNLWSSNFAKAILPPPDINIWEWADKYRVIPKGAGSEPGRWRTDRTPYSKEIMFSLSPQCSASQVIVIKGTQLGCALSLDTKIPTVSGWTTMGDINVGDKIFDELGKQCSVTFVTDVMYEHDCYEVTFSDNSTIIADKDHRWFVDRYIGTTFKRFEQKVVTTGSMVNDFKHGKRNRYAINVCEPIDCEEKELKIDPYVLGYWLGDGNRHANRVTTSLDDVEEINEYIKESGYKTKIENKWSRGNAVEIVIEPKMHNTHCKRGHSYEKEGRLKNGTCRECVRQRAKTKAYPHLGNRVDSVTQNIFFHKELKNIGSYPFKIIPVEYLRASKEQRLSLLQGLMDSDGSISKDGTCEFYNTDKNLLAQVYELIASLGLKPVCSFRKTKGGVVGGRQIVSDKEIGKITFRAYSDLLVARLKRKNNNQAVISSEKRVSETKRRRIVDIKKVDSVPVRCIQVDSPTHLYLCGEAFIPTHNTEIGTNMLGYYIDIDPAPMGLWMPTDDLAKKHCKKRLWKMVEATPILNSKVAPRATAQNSSTLQEWAFAGGSLSVGGSNSGAMFRSDSYRIIILDDMDGFAKEVGDEGSPAELAEKRTDTYPNNKKIYKNSTPTIKGESHIESEYEDSDQREFYLPCPHCNEKQIISFDNMKWGKKENGKREGDVFLTCKNCGTAIYERSKQKMMLKGEWIPHNPDNPKRGYKITSLYSPWVSWNQIVDEFIEANRLAKIGDKKRLKTWINTRLAESYDENPDTIKHSELFERREEYAEEVPNGGLILIAAGDTQDDRIEVEVSAFGRYGEEWSIDRKVFTGDPALPDVWERLDEFLLSATYNYEGGGKMKIYAFGIDTGGNKTTHVYKYCRPRHSRRVFGLKGSSAIDAPIYTRSMSKAGGIKMPLYMLGVNQLKDEVHSSLMIDEVGASYIHFPKKDSYSESYFTQLTAEKKIRGKWTNQGGKRNEAFDIKVYSRATLAITGIDLNKLSQRGAFLYLGDEEKEQAKPKRRIISKGIQ